MRRNGLASIKRLKKGDFFLILFLLLAAFSLLAFQRMTGKAGKQVEVRVDGELYGTWPLDEDREILISEGEWRNVLTIHDVSVDMTEADCRDRICVSHAKIRKSGETIVCLPHKIVVEIVGEEDSGTEEPFDAIAN